MEHPAIKEELEGTLPLAARHVFRLGAAVYMIPLLVVLSVVFAGTVWFDVPLWGRVASALVAVCGLVYVLWNVLWYQRVKQTRFHYVINEWEVRLRFGVLIHGEAILPMTKVQFVERKQGPLLRYFRLQTIRIGTAGGVHEIPALHEEVAQALLKVLSVYARIEEDEEI